MDLHSEAILDIVFLRSKFALLVSQIEDGFRKLNNIEQSLLRGEAHMATAKVTYNGLNPELNWHTWSVELVGSPGDLTKLYFVRKGGRPYNQKEGQPPDLADTAGGMLQDPFVRGGRAGWNEQGVVTVVHDDNGVCEFKFVRNDGPGFYDVDVWEGCSYSIGSKSFELYTPAAAPEPAAP